MRLFIALMLDGAAADELAALRDSLHDRSSSGSFVPRENLHITLEFLGECTPLERRKAEEAMESIAFSPFRITMDKLGFFSRPDGDTWWAGAEESAPLMNLSLDLRRELSERGFRLDKRRFRPHATLGRRVVTDAAAGSIKPIYASAEAVSLMLSERGERGMVYTVLHERKAGE